MCFDLVSYFFLKLSKIDISENFEKSPYPGQRGWNGWVEAEQQDD